MNEEDFRQLSILLAKLEVALEAGDAKVAQRVETVKGTVSTLETRLEKALATLEQTNININNISKDLKELSRNTNKMEATLQAVRDANKARHKELEDQVAANTRWRESLTNRAIGLALGSAVGGGGFVALVTRLLSGS